MSTFHHRRFLSSPTQLASSTTALVEKLLDQSKFPQSQLLIGDTSHCQRSKLKMRCGLQKHFTLDKKSQLTAVTVFYLQIEKSKDSLRFSRRGGENWRSGDTISCKVRVLVNSPEDIAQEVVAADLRGYFHPASSYIYILSPFSCTSVSVSANSKRWQL